MKKKLIAGGVAALALTGAGLGFSNLAGADTASLHFNDTTQLVELTIPDPACVAHGCQWELQVDNPATNQVYGSGNAGEPGVTIDVPYPSDFCGVIQADVFVLGDDGSQHLQFGHRHTISTCTTTTTTTTIGCPPEDTPPPCTTPTSVPSTTPTTTAGPSPTSVNTTPTSAPPASTPVPQQTPVAPAVNPGEQAPITPGPVTQGNG